MLSWPVQMTIFMQIGFIAILLLLALILEGTVTSLPLVLICLLCFAIIFRSPAIFFIAFISGLLLDLLTLHAVGGASIYFLFFLLLVFLYQRKYEIDSLPFVILSSFFGSWGFLTIFGYGNTFFLSLVSAISAVLLYKIVLIVKAMKGERK